MTMKRIVILSLMAIACIMIQAQDKKATILANGGVWVPNPTVTIDKKSKKSTAVWNRTEKDDWFEDSGLMVENVPTIDDIESLLPGFDENQKDRPFAPMIWQLIEEDNETVLHCYFRMPADIVTNFWLTDEEGGILDKETGITYRARRTEPDCYYKRFGIKGKKGQMLDFKIYFPKLPESARKIAIYGVPNWQLRGWNVELNRNSSGSSLANGKNDGYDNVPQFHKPTLVAEAKNYDKDNFFTWSEYTDVHLIKPTDESTMAIWITPEATYLALATEMNWRREYFGRGGANILIDNAGRQYKCKGVVDFPNNTCFWVQGMSGDHFAIVEIYEPIPPTISTINYIVPEGEPFKAYNASWKGYVRTDLSIKELRENQKLFEYFPRQMVK